MNESGTKARILFLYQYLLTHTDEKHPITTADLIRICEENGHKLSRNTIPDDMASLSASGLDIMSKRVGNGKAYNVGMRVFEPYELKMLIDAVSSSRFITAEASETLIRKITGLTNEQNRGNLTARIYTSDRLKSSTSAALNISDTICEAIENGRKISFQYWDYNADKEKVLRHDGEVYTVSPYALIWNDDRYYLAGYSDKHEKVVSFRVDRMCEVKEIEEEARKEEFNAAEYARTAIKMYDGDVEEQRVELLCENQFMQNVVDRFGEETETWRTGEDKFIAEVVVRPSRTFFSWVFQFCGGITIAGPDNVRAEYEKMLRKVTREQKKATIKPGEDGATGSEDDHTVDND